MGAKSLKSILGLALALLIVLSQFNVNVAFAESSGGTDAVQEQQLGSLQKDGTDENNTQSATLGLSETTEIPSGAPKITPFAVSNYNHVFYDSDGIIITDSRVKIPPSVTTGTNNNNTAIIIVNDMISSIELQYKESIDLLTVVSLYPYKNVSRGYDASDASVNVLSYATREQIAGQNDIYKIDIDYMAEDLSLVDGRYTLYFFNDIDTFILSFNVVNIEATIDITAAKTTTTGIPVNPTALDIGHKTGSTADNAIIADIEYEWAIYKAADVTIAPDGTSTVAAGATPLHNTASDMATAINALATVDLTGFYDGKYVLIQKSILPTIYADETGVTDRNLHLVDDNIAKPFIIIHPVTTINGYRGLDDGSQDPSNVIADPSAVTLTSKYTADGSDMASTVKWEIFEWNGITSVKAATDLSGKSEALDLTSYSLVPGTYKIKVIETIDSTSETHDTWASFVIPEKANVAVEYYLQDATGVMQELDKTGWPITVSGLPTASEATSLAPTSGYDYTTAGKNYELVEVKEKIGAAGETIVTPSSANKYTADFPAHNETTVVKYYYKETAQLIVNHVFYEEDGTTISPTQPTIPVPTTSGYVGEPYTTTPLTSTSTTKIPDGYELIAVPVNQNGDYVSGTTTVTYEYKKIPSIPTVNQSKVTVVHEFEDGEVILASVTTEKTPGSPYSSNSLAGYTLVKVEVNGMNVGTTSGVDKYPANGLETTIKYIYKKPIPAGNGQVIVEHVIQHSDGTTTTYLTEVPIVDSVGNPYTSVPENIQGYTLTAVPGNQNGSIETTTKTVTYIYVPDPAAAQLVEKHILLDELGREIGFVANPKVSSQPGGTQYSTGSAPPLGYELVEVKGDMSGLYVNGTEKQVTYYYKPLSSKVTPPIYIVSTGGGRTTFSSGTNRPDVSPNLKYGSSTDPKNSSGKVGNSAPSEGEYVNRSPSNVNDNPGTGR